MEWILFSMRMGMGIGGLRWTSEYSVCAPPLRFVARHGRANSSSTAAATTTVKEIIRTISA